MNKLCPACETWKSTDEFHKNRSKPDGLQSICKQCRTNRNERYNQREWRKESIQRYSASNKGKASRKRYEKTDKGKAAKRKYNQTDERRQIARTFSARFREKNPQKIRAQWAVGHAVKTGQMPPARDLTCSDCGKPAKDYHHWDYEKEHWLDVIPLCDSCHVKADNERRLSS